MSNEPILLDCTLRDGGYYNYWDFPQDLINNYLQAMLSSDINIVELGFRSLSNNGFKGACAFTTDDFIRSLDIPKSLKIGVMVNASELVNGDLQKNVQKLFPETTKTSPVQIVRIACHYHEFFKAIEATQILKAMGFVVGFNIMQIAERSEEEIVKLSIEASKWPLDVLYFADSMGSMDPKHATQIIHALRKEWSGNIGIHCHDNMGLALQNTLKAFEEGVTWLDSTVTGMGRGPGNTQTERLAIEIATIRKKDLNLTPLMEIIDNYFKPLQDKCGWGTNTYYYLAGKHGIHPSYIQEMINDSRYSSEDIFAVIDKLKVEGGKKFSNNTLDSARNFYQGEPRGKWSPESLLKGQEVLLLGAGPGVKKYKTAIEKYILKENPYVIALNTQNCVSESLINAKIACHPIRLLADYRQHLQSNSPLITPYSMLPDELQNCLSEKNEIFDYGISVQKDKFDFQPNFGTLPNSLVISYALALATSGKAKKISLVGFDGYGEEDQRNTEMNNLFKIYTENKSSLKITSLTPTKYKVPTSSIYSL